MERSHLAIIIVLVFSIAGMITPVMLSSLQNLAKPTNSRANNLRPWIPIGGERTTLSFVREKLAIPLRLPSERLLQEYDMRLTNVLYHGTQDRYYLIYLIYGKDPIDNKRMSIEDVITSGHVVVIEGDSGWPTSYTEQLIKDVSNGVFPQSHIVHVRGLPAILSHGDYRNEIIIYQGTIIYDVLAPKNISDEQLIQFIESMFLDVNP